MHLAFFKKANLITFHAPIVSIDLTKDMDIYSVNMMFDTLSKDKKIVYKNPDETSFESLSNGYAEGTLIGGNFAVMMSSFGTEYMPKGKDYILYIEDIDEQPYKIDRFISTLFISGEIEKSIKGIVVGDFINCTLKKGEKSTGFRFTKETLEEPFGYLNIPVISNVRCGHNKAKMIIAHGARVIIDTNKKIFETLENALV